MSKQQQQQQQQQQHMTDKPRKSGALVAFCGRRSACGGGSTDLHTHPKSEYEILSSLLGELGMTIAIGDAFHTASDSHLQGDTRSALHRDNRVRELLRASV